MTTNSFVRAMTLLALALGATALRAEEERPALLPEHVDQFKGERDTFVGVVERALRQNL